MNLSLTSLPVAEGIALAVPASFALAALLPHAPSSRRMGVASLVAFGLAVLFAACLSLGWHAPLAGASLGVRVDVVTATMLLLVCGIGAVIVRYSHSYLRDEAELPRYLRALASTLAGVTALVVTDHLLVMAVAWTATSLSLHQLLTHYAGRTAALLAAHKKFLVSRLADVCMVACLALVHSNVGSLDLGSIAAWSDAHPALTPSMHGAAVLLVLAVALKSAQLPFHGWLMQVMEAPTPVSALLHAGVVNVGGFVLIRLAPLLVHAEPARGLLVAIGLATAIAGSLVATTRVSVKVALAWSTCAQMGFMLVEIGLGAFDLALLHLTAHSLYKAHAFLGSGSTVEVWKVTASTAPRRTPSLARLATGVLVALASAVVASVVSLRLLGSAPAQQPTVITFACLVGLSTVALVTRSATHGGATMLAARVGVVVVAYTTLHAAVEHLLPGYAVAPNPVALASVMAGFVALFALTWTLELAPASRLSRALHPWLFAGFHLDDHFTRIAFRILPPRLPRTEASVLVPVAKTQEA